MQRVPSRFPLSRVTFIGHASSCRHSRHPQLTASLPIDCYPRLRLRESRDGCEGGKQSVAPLLRWLYEHKTRHLGEYGLQSRVMRRGLKMTRPMRKDTLLYCRSKVNGGPDERFATASETARRLRPYNAVANEITCCTAHPATEATSCLS